MGRGEVDFISFFLFLFFSIFFFFLSFSIPSFSLPLSLSLFCFRDRFLN